MTLEQQLWQRSGGKCELCGSEHALSTLEIAPADAGAETAILLCATCLAQIDQSQPLDANHWRCLNEAIWNPHPVVQVVAYRQLQQLDDHDWARSLAEMMYMEESTREWALQNSTSEETGPDIFDSNGNRLAEGDDVILIKDLEIKGGNFTAKRGTLVKKIHLTDNPKHIEGKINGMQIVIVAAYTKRA
ncbi:MAG: PhnA domain-containing protein [Thiotrichales bacterium]|nr:PhnA domain-containing protein [Thiotrichales bacterium]